MAIKITLKNSVVENSVPTTTHLAAVGELALNANINSLGIYMRASDNTIVKMAGPGSLTTPAASTTVAGISEYATNTETTTGTSTTRSVTPAGLAAVTSAERSTSNSTYLALAGGTLTNPLVLPNASNAAPALTGADTDSGVYFATNSVSLAAGGVQGLSVNGTDVRIPTKLGINGATPSTPLDVIANASGYAMAIRGRSADDLAQVRFASNDYGTIYAELESDATYLATRIGGSEALRVDSSGRLLVGHSSSRQIGGITGIFQIEGTTANSSSVSLVRNAADNGTPFLVLGKSRGAAVGSNTIVQDNDGLGEIRFTGADGTDLNTRGATIEAFVDGTPGANDMPGRLVFSTTADGSATPTTRLTITSAGVVNVPDNGKFTAGASNDLQIFHDGTNSGIQNTGGGLFLTTSSSGIFLRKDATEELGRFNVDGSVQLYYNNSKKLETTSGGVQISGTNLNMNSTYIDFSGSISTPNTAAAIYRPADNNLAFSTGNTERLLIHTSGITITGNSYVTGNDDHPDNSQSRFGTSNDLQIYHDGSDSYINESGTGDLIINSSHIIFQDGGTEVFESTATGARFKDSKKLLFGSGNDLEIYHDGNNSFIKDAGTGRLSIVTSQLQLTNAADSEVMIKATQNGAVELYWDGSKKLDTYTGGVIVHGELHVASHVVMEDNDIIKLGSSADLQIYHDGSNSYINDTGTGGIKILTGGLQVKNAADNSYMAFFGSTGATELYNDGSKKFYTHSGGAYCVGNLGASGELYLPDSGKLVCGGGDDLQIFFDGTNGYMYAGNDGRSGPVIKVENQGNNNNRDGILIQCGKDDSSGTNVALEVKDGNGTTQGHLLFTNGTLSLDPFTAAHPCIVPDADNPSDESMAYPYGTLLETTDIEYKKNPDGSSTERGIIYKVQKTQSANSKKVLGAYSGSMNNRPDNGPNMHHVYVLGDGHILVNNAGGNIEIGDGICSSATAGIGQKATANPSMIIGIAQEAITFTGSETKLVAVQYGLQQFTPWT